LEYTNLSFAQDVSVVSKSCFHNIRDLRRSTVDQTAACTIATSLIHSKIELCNSLLLNLLAVRLQRLYISPPFRTYIYNNERLLYPKCKRNRTGTLQLVRIIKEKGERREMF